MPLRIIRYVFIEMKIFSIYIFIKNVIKQYVQNEDILKMKHIFICVYVYMYAYIYTHMRLDTTMVLVFISR